MKEYVYGKKSLITFFIVVIILSAIVDIMYCEGYGDYFVAVLMWMPALAALIANIVNFIDKKEKFSFKVLFERSSSKLANPFYLALAILIPFIYLFIPYRVYWTIYPDNYAYTGVSIVLVLKDCFVYTIVCIVAGLLTATGEEIGWRGFMVPALIERIGTKKTLIYSSLFWCLWHFPLLIWGGYMEGTSLLYSLIAFVLCILPVGIICGYLRIKSNSVWPCALLHAAHNAFDQSVFSLLTRGDNKMYFVSETGIFTIVCAWIIVYVIYRESKKSINNY